MQSKQRGKSARAIDSESAMAELGQTVLAQQRDATIRPLPDGSDRDAQQLGDELNRTEISDGLRAGHLPVFPDVNSYGFAPELSRHARRRQANFPSALVHFDSMNTTSRLRILLTERGVPPNAHTRALADAAGISIQAVRLWFSHTTENIRNDHLIAVAREFKTTTDWLLMGRGPMDDPYSTAFRIDKRASGKNKIGSNNEYYIQIKSFENPGHVKRTNRPMPDLADDVEGVTVSSRWLSHYCNTYSAIDNLALLNAVDDSMQESFKVGDTLLIDKGVTELTSDGIYLFKLESETFIKRLQRLPGGSVRVISDNNRYESFEITSKMREKLIVTARILLVWNARKM